MMRKFNWMLLVLLVLVGCGDSPTVTSESDDFDEIVVKINDMNETIVVKINDMNERLELLDKKFE
ncbi:MAG: hypothetical protein QGG39_18950 [Candidatus Poribacteria bacterium]|nr:hypothetical protein [Candidatus Poribacteria bacterium]